VIENLSVATVDVVEGLDQSGVDRSFDGQPAGGSFALKEVDGPKDRGPSGLVSCLYIKKCLK
jgi:hypothetical protein